MITLAQIIQTNLFKAVTLAAMLFVAHRWSKGDYDKSLKHLKHAGKEYGVVTLLLIAAWWFITPTGTIEDVTSVWLLAKLGMVLYVLMLGLLTVYLVWRLKVTIVIYKGK